jgi:cytochrome c oxidase subunit IV
MKRYWLTWAVLLVLTVLMLWMDTAPIPRLFFVSLMVVAMMVKASIIAGNFMHLRSERLSLVLMVVVGLVVTAVVLYALIVPDALRIHHMIETARS